MNAFFTKVADDDRLYPTHISLYLALFQIWNSSRFKNPLSIARSEVMRLSKMGSTNTYAKCMRELNAWGYIGYVPSTNPVKGSRVNMFNFDTSGNTSTDTSGELALRPYIKHNKQLKHINKHVNQNKNYDEPL